MTTYQFAGFWRRFIAYMIDGFIIGMILMFLMMISGIAYLAGSMSGSNVEAIAMLADPERMAELSVWSWMFSVLLNMIYFTYFHGSTGRTPGKRLLGLQVVSVEGTPISFGTAFLRSVGYLVSSVVFCLGYLWIAFDKKKQGWHDKIAATVVIIHEPQESTSGITIPDTKGESQGTTSFGSHSGNVGQTETYKPEMSSWENTTGGNNQKIP